MIQIIIVIIIISILLLIKEYILDIIFEEENKSVVVINENKNCFILFKKNDSVSDMKILNILYQCNDDEEVI